jgi:hypothetical protein
MASILGEEKSIFPPFAVDSKWRDGENGFSPALVSTKGRRSAKAWS